MTLDEFVRKGWNEHGDDPAAVFARLPAGIALATERAHWAPLAGLVVHVAGEHLGRWDDAIALLDRLMASPGFDAGTPEGKAVLRSKATLHLAAGRRAEADRLEKESRSATSPNESNRVRMLTVAATSVLGQGRVADASTMLEEALSLASYGPGKDDPAARSLAVTGNNLACSLEQKQGRTAQETSLMVRAAETGLKYWSLTGTWLETERAHYRLSQSLRKAGDRKGAIEQARRCLSIVEQNGNDPGEAFYAREALALAHHDDGDGRSAALEREAASAVLPSIGDEGFRSMAAASLADLDRALAGASS